MDWKGYVLLCTTLTCGVLVVGVTGECSPPAPGQPGIQFDNVTWDTYLVWCEETNATLDTHFARQVDAFTCDDGDWPKDAPTKCITQNPEWPPFQPCASGPTDPDSSVRVKDVTTRHNDDGSDELLGRYYKCEDGMEWLSGSWGRLTQCLRGKWTSIGDECTPACPVARDCHNVAALGYTANDTYEVITSGNLDDQSTKLKCEFLVPEEGVWSTVGETTADGLFTKAYTETTAGNFFIGLDNLVALNRELDGSMRPLVFQLIFTTATETHHATYDNVTIGSGPEYTLLSLGNYHGDAGDALHVCLGKAIHSSFKWWESSTGVIPTFSERWTANGSPLAYTHLQLRVRSRAYDQNISCPGLNYNSDGSQQPSSNWEGHVPLSRAPGAVVTYNCTGGFFYKEGIDLQGSGARECIEDTSNGGKYAWNASVSLPCIYACPSDFHLSTDNTTCYHFSSAPATGGIIQAARECQQMGALLAQITTSNVPWALAKTSEYYFIGHTVMMGDIESDLPADYNCTTCPQISEVQCVAAKQGTYENHNCMDPSRHYLCQMLGSCPSTYTLHRGRCYRYERTSNTDPQGDCIQDGGTLAYPETLDDLHALKSYYMQAKGGTTGTVLIGLNDALGNWTAGKRYNPSSDLTDLAINATATDRQHWRTLTIDSTTDGLPSFTPIDLMSMSTIDKYICQYPSPPGCTTDPPQPTVNMTDCSANSSMGYGIQRCYKCLPGYFLNGNASAPTEQYSECFGVLGEWHPMDLVDCLLAEVCGEIQAPTIPGTTNSSDGTNIRYLNATMSFTCPENLTTANLTAVQNITCIEDGDGIYRFDPVLVQECNVCADEPPAVANATLPDHDNSSFYTVNTSTSATCIEEHVFAVGVTTLELNCTLNGWMEAAGCYAACVMNPPEAGSNIERENLTDIAIGTELMYTCSEGFYIPPELPGGAWVNSIGVKCNTSHQWDPLETINCVKACVLMDPPSPINGNSSWDNFTRVAGTEIDLTCPANHTFANLTTSMTLKCEESGNWTQVDENVLHCRIPCLNTTLPTLPNNSIRAGPDPPFWVGDTVNYTCGPLQESEQRETRLGIKCEADIGWINFDSNFACFNICQMSPYSVNLPAASDWNNLTRTVGTKVTYSCPTGMVFADLNSTVEVECEESSRKWTTIDTDIFICRTKCEEDPPPTPANTTRSYEPPYWQEEPLTFSCSPGYATPTGGTNITITCHSNNTWTPIDPAFECIDGCFKPAPIPPGKATSTDRSLQTKGAVVTYTCEFGFEDGPNTHTSTCTEDRTWQPLVFHGCEDPNGSEPEEPDPFPDTNVHNQSYDQTTDKHFPDIEKSFSDANGVDQNYKSTSGPFGFNKAIHLTSEKEQCMKKQVTTDASSDCTHNPVTCASGLSISLWIKKVFPMDAFLKCEQSHKFPRHYTFSTGGDDQGHPGVAIYQQGVALEALVSTGAEYWKEKVYGAVYNDTWTNVGIVWDKDSGLKITVNNFVKCEREKPQTAPTEKPGLSPPQTIIGCHKTGSDQEYSGYTDAELDELAMWSKPLEGPELLFMLGGYDNNPSISEFEVLLNNSDMSDPNQKIAAMTFLSDMLAGGDSTAAAAAASGNNSTTTTTNSTTTAMEQKERKEAENFRRAVNMTWDFLNPDNAPGCLKGDGVEESLVVAGLLSNLLSSDKQAQWHDYHNDTSKGPLPLLDRAMAYVAALGKASGCDKNVKEKHEVTEDRVHMEINRWKISRLQQPSVSFFGPTYSSRSKLGNQWGDSRESVTVAMGTHTDPRCKDRVTNLVVSIYDNVNKHELLNLDSGMFNQKATHTLDSRVAGLTAATDLDMRDDNKINPYSPHCDLDSPTLRVYYNLVHLVQMPSRRAPKFHSDEPVTKIYTRHCVRWNPLLGEKGGWDKTDCWVAYSTIHYTRCICKQTGLYAVMAEHVEPKDTGDLPDWLPNVLLALYAISGVCLIFFILVVALVGVLKEQFHLLGLCLAVSLLGGSCAMIASFFDTVTEDRHDCAAVGIVLHICYLGAGAWIAMIGHAAFKCITSGIVEGQLKQYALLASGLTFFCVGIPLTFYLQELGDDPFCFISWEEHPKYFFFGPLTLFGAAALFCVGVIFLNLHTAALRNNPTMEDYRTFSIGSAVLIIYFSIIWVFGGLTYMRVDLGFSVYPIFQILNSLMGVMLLLCIGIGSSRFRMAVLGQAKRRTEMFQNYVRRNDKEPLQQSSPQASATTPPTRPASRAFSADGARSKNSDSMDVPSRPSSSGAQMVRPWSSPEQHMD